jgi:hypothetical protein
MMLPALGVRPTDRRRGGTPMPCGGAAQRASVRERALGCRCPFQFKLPMFERLKL